MANVYTFTPNEPQEDFNKSDPNYQIASVAYVCFLVKKLSDILEEHINKSHSIDNKEKIEINTTESVDICELPTNTSIDSLEAKNVSTDSKHKFISEAQLNILKNKPSYIELQTIIMDLRNEFKSNLNASYTNLLNTPDALQKLKDIANLLEEEENLNKFISDISHKVDKKEFDEHISSVFHLNNNDRKALNLLIGFIEKGCADWNASENEPNFIRNKPSKLPADGGDADTVGGFAPELLLNHQLENCIFGMINNGYDETSVDIMLKNQSECDEIISSIKDTHEGLYSFKSGGYIFEKFDLDMKSIKSGDIIIRGVGTHNTIFKSKSAIINGLITIEDLSFTQTPIHIVSNCIFDNVYFINCTIYFDACNEITVRNCIFKNCQIIYNGSCMNMLIIGNRFINSGYVQYISRSSIINDNLYY